MKKTAGYIQIYSRKVRDQIMELGENFLVKAGIEHISNELFSCSDEIIKNAVKANYKFVLIKEKIIKNILSNYPEKNLDEVNKEINEIIKVRESFDHLADGILRNEDISGTVRGILDEEGKLLNIKNRAYLENRKLSEDEKKIIESLNKINDMRKKIQENDIKIILKLQSDNDYIFIEFTNTAPILTKDINRIQEKREEYKKYKDSGKEHEFFINNIDTSESGFGLGYAKIDAILNSWGLDTARALTIISSINTTIMLSLPIEELKRV